jgi:DNA replicative helicase MCM subunit Mcm2 (Cdc46/Mcm family)
MHGARIFFSDQHLSQNSMVEGTYTHFEHLFKSFIHNFSRENTRVYQKRLEHQIRNNKHVLKVNLADLRSFDEQLYDQLTSAPLEVLTVMEASVKNYLKENIEEYSLKTEEDWQVALISDDHPVRIR